MKKLGLAILPFLLWGAVSCSEPTLTGTFVKASKRGADGYAFTLDFSDTTTYSMSFYTRIDSPEREFIAQPQLSLEVSLISPSGKIYRETVIFPKDKFVDYQFYTKNYRLPYRENFTPVEYGSWRMNVAVLGEENVRGFRGLGVEIRKNK